MASNKGKRVQGHGFRYEVMCKRGARRRREGKREAKLRFMHAFIRKLSSRHLDVNPLAYSLISFIYYLGVRLLMRRLS